jgi:hypothetical protein
MQNVKHAGLLVDMLLLHLPAAVKFANLGAIKVKPSQHHTVVNIVKKAKNLSVPLKIASSAQ